MIDRLGLKTEDLLGPAATPSADEPTKSHKPH